MHGLPELARYFLVDKKVELPDEATIFSHVKPHSLEGLFSSRDKSSDGYDRTCVCCAFLCAICLR